MLRCGAVVGHRVADPLDVLGGLLGLHMNSMNNSAVPGCFALTGMQKLSLPTGSPSLHFWNR
jgi:hypothetical protein